MDDRGDGRTRMTEVDLCCASCGTQLGATAKFCFECGAPVVAATAEYKQVTVLFADVVHSMDIASAVGAERLREIMAELLDSSTAVVRRYGGTLDKFTGDGIMAVFGAPNALEDHAFRACLAALDIQAELVGIAAKVRGRDGVTLEMRIGLNSGRVIAGEIGSAIAKYTAIGEQVGMAQRMESVAPPGGVMLSASTARLVESAVVLLEPELVRFKGAGTPVHVRRLVAVGDHATKGHRESPLVGRAWELDSLTGILEETITGAGSFVTILGLPGIGKSRLVREITLDSARRGLPIVSTHCESHESDIPFLAVARLLRAATGVSDSEPPLARRRIRERYREADVDDLLLLDDLLGIRDAATPLPAIAPDARRRRLTALIIAVLLGREEPAVYVIEDAHWIDEVSESMLADCLTAIPQTRSLVLVTCRPEYRGALTQLQGAHTITLRPLSDADTLALTSELLGDDPSMADLTAQVANRAAGNPFFAEEIVRDLDERDVLDGGPGAYRLRVEVADVRVPATLQATIGARIDRLRATAKQTLNAAAVIGTRFDLDLLHGLVPRADLEPLISAELVDEMRFASSAVYTFRHPLVRTVAYESQLKSDRAQLHRRLATVLGRDPDLADEKAALIAAHLEDAGDLNEAYAWHMRAGAWYNYRDISAARTSWRRAWHVGDRLPADAPGGMGMRIAPRTLLCGTSYRVGGRGAEAGFDELRGLCNAANDQRSLAIGMAGLVLARNFRGNCREASRLATELLRLLDSISDPTLTLTLSFAAMMAKHETAEMAEVLRLADRVIDLAKGDPNKGNLIIGSPLTFAIVLRGAARWCLGIRGWQEDLDEGIAMARAFYPTMLAGMMWRKYVMAIPYGVLLADSTALHDTAETLSIAERSGDDLALDLARTTRGVALVHHGGRDREAGFGLLAQIRDRALGGRFASIALPVADTHIAMEKLRLGDIGGAIGTATAVVKEVSRSGAAIWDAFATSVLVEALIQRCGEADLADAHSAINRLAAMPIDPGFVLNEISLLRLRALLARSQRDETSYRCYRNSYRTMAGDLGFEGHIAMAESMN